MFPDAIIFDMDGVLVDSEPLHVEATRLLLADRGIVFAPGHDDDFFGCTDREVCRRLRDRYGLATSEDDLAEEWIARALGLLTAPIVPMPGVPEVLDRLRSDGVRLALASSSSPPIITATLASLRLDGVFEFAVSGRDVPRGKPAPDIFLEAMRRLGVSASECLVVEDSQNGLRAAVAAAIPCVAVPCASTSGQDFSLAAVRLESLRGLPAWLDGLPTD